MPAPPTITAMRALVAAADAGTLPEEARPAIDAFRRYLAAPATMTVDEALGLKVWDGATPWYELEAIERRNALLRRAAELVAPTTAATTMAVARGIASRCLRRRPGDPHDLAAIIAALTTCGAAIPTAKTIGRIVGGRI